MKHQFSADRAIDKIEQDRLGRSGFAAHLAEAALNWKENDSLVLALYGEWGSGKTSVKNLFKRHCETKGEKNIVEFNPWQWSAQDKIFEAFFKTIGERLGKQDVASETKALAKKWRYFAASWGIGAEIAKNIQNAALQLILIAAVAGSLPTSDNPWVKIPIRFISIAGLMIGGLAVVLPGIFEKVIGFFEAKADHYERTLDERREELVIELEKLTKPIIVVIDDIDRLNQDEIRLVIQLIKANSNLPKVVYFLLFQQETVIAALQEISCQNGGEFLEKIVQVGFDLPRIPDTKIHKVLFDGLNETFAETDVGNRWDKERWESIFDDHLKYFFRTPRDVFRFLSTLRFHVGIYKNKGVLEVNPIDLIALEVLRVFSHSAYARLKDSFAFYTDFIQRLIYSKQTKSGKIDIVMEDVLAGLNEIEKKHVQGIIMELFPQTSPHFSGDDQHGWNSGLRICDKNHFPKYFELTLREEMLSELEFSLLLKSANDSKSVAAAVAELSKRGLLDDLLDRLEQNLATIQIESIEPLSVGILTGSDDFPANPQPGLFEFPPEVKVTRLIRRLLWKLPESARADAMRRILSASKAITVPAMIVNADDRKQTDDPQKQYLFAESDLKKVREACVESIKKAAVDGSLPKTENFLMRLQDWRIWSGTDEAKNWATSYVKDFDSALNITMSAISVSTTSGHWGTKHEDTLLLKWIEQYVDLEKVWGFLSATDKTLLDERQRHLISLFKKGLESKKRGESYDQIREH